MSNILIISPEHWEGHSVSKHHYARELVRRGHRVLFHGPPEVGPLRLEQIKVEGSGRLEVLRAPRVAPGLRLLPKNLRRRLEARWLAQVERQAKTHVEVVWLFENSRFFDMNFAGERLKIYHQVDLNQDFHPREAAASSDLAIALSRPIEVAIAGSAKQFLRLTHGCFQNAKPELAPPELEAVFQQYRVNAVITGNLAIAYLDTALLADLVAENPNVAFHFVGRFIEGQGLHADLCAAPNAVFWDQQPAEALPSFLRRADVLLVAYLAEEHLDQLANPHKIMEYLASGRCVLATRTLEYADRPDLLETARNREDFKNRFASIVSNPSAFNAPDLVARRRAFAADNTYSRQVDRIVEALGPCGELLA